MVQLQNFVYCSRVKQKKNKIVIFDVQQSKVITDKLSIWIMFSLVNIEPVENQKLKIKFINQTGGIITELPLIEVNPPLKNQSQSCQFSFELKDLKIVEEGKYATVILFNDIQVGYIPINLYKKLKIE